MSQTTPLPRRPQASQSSFMHVCDLLTFLIAVAIVAIAANSIFHALAGHKTHVVVSLTVTAVLDIAGVVGVLTTILGWLRLRRVASYLYDRNEDLMRDNQDLLKQNEALRLENEALRSATSHQQESENIGDRP